MIAFPSGIRLRLLLWVGLCLGGGRLGAQDFALSVTSTPNPPVVNNSMTFSINLTNTSGFLRTNITVINTLPSGITFISAAAVLGNVTNNGRVQTFTLDALLNNQGTVLTVLARPTVTGNFTNLTAVSASNAIPASFSYPFTVYAAAANLAVGLGGFASGVLSNDLTGYTLSATNSGSSVAPNVLISNLLPTGIKFLSITPSNSTVSFATNLLTIRLPSLNGGGVTNYRVGIQPTNAGTFQFTAGISAPELFETNSADNSVAGTLTVGDFLTGSLVATVVSGQVYNPQTGLMEQTIRLSNLGTNPVASARVFVIGLTNLLYNAVGTNSGSPYVIYANTLAPATSVDLLLEYFVPTRLPVSDPALLAVEVPAFDPTGPTGSPPEITRLVYTNGNVLVEFQSTPGKTYTILYSNDASFTNAYSAQPPIKATADRTQWIDSGPPKTISAPGASRYYRALQNP